LSELKPMKGVAVDLAPFISNEQPFNTLASVLDLAGINGYKGVHIPAGDPRLIDLEKAAANTEYCNELNGLLPPRELAWSGMSCLDEGELLGAHRAYLPLFSKGDAPADPAAAGTRLGRAIAAARQLGIRSLVTLSGPLLWSFAHNRKTLSAGLVNDSFAELAKRWRPILDQCGGAGIELCFLTRAGQDVHDGVSFERFLRAVGNHKACRIAYHPAHLLLQQVDYLQFIDVYAERIGYFLVGDAEFTPSGRTGAHGGFSPEIERAPRLRAPGDGTIDFAGVFSRLTSQGFAGWATLDYACVLKHPLVGIREGQQFIESNLIRPAGPAPETATVGGNEAAEWNRRILGLG
jgi:sugar phosphate isomerase/epimerase